MDILTIYGEIFVKKNYWNFVQFSLIEEYSGILVKKLYQEGNHEKASQYFNRSYDAKELL